jgi:arsenate reductase
MDMRPRELLRQKGTPYDQLGLGDAKWSEDQLIDVMLEHPMLINRPIVVTDLGGKLCRRSETVLALLPQSQEKPFVKEDGTPVT